MAVLSYADCSCCGRGFVWRDAGQDPPARCPMCAVRNSLCQHNYSAHRERGAHSSQPHYDGVCPSRCWQTLKDSADIYVRA